jgi:hypothetical protein
MKKTILAVIAVTVLAVQSQIASARDFRFSLNVPGVAIGVGDCGVRHLPCYGPSPCYAYYQAPAPCARVCGPGPVCVSAAPVVVYPQAVCLHPIPVVRIHMDDACYYGYYRPYEHRHCR